jgi:hypothetical protein
MMDHVQCIDIFIRNHGLLKSKHPSKVLEGADSADCGNRKAKELQS